MIVLKMDLLNATVCCYWFWHWHCPGENLVPSRMMLDCFGEGSRRRVQETILLGNICVWRFCCTAFLVRALSMFMNNSASGVQMIFP